MALVALMQARQGRAALAAHLPLLAAVAVKALDPAHPARRRALVQARAAAAGSAQGLAQALKRGWRWRRS